MGDTSTNIGCDPQEGNVRIVGHVQLMLMLHYGCTSIPLSFSVVIKWFIMLSAIAHVVILLT
jgi:hypothetical protein